MSDHVLAITLGLSASVLFVLTCVYSYFREKKVVKAGHCGLPWVHFDVDSQGGHGLKCAQCGISTWVSWYTKGPWWHGQITLSRPSGERRN